MNNSQVKQGIKSLKRGILPYSLNFSLEPLAFDITKIQELQYNAFYRSYEFFEDKFPKGHEGIIGFDRVIQSIADRALTPLEEMELRQQIPKDDQIIIPNDIKQESLKTLEGIDCNKDYYLE